MIQQYKSDSLKLLADAVCRAECFRKGVFSPHFIVTGHKSSYQWLRERLAVNNGIAAHQYHKSTDGFTEMIYQVLEAGPPKSEMMDGAQLVWLIDGVLAANSTDWEVVSEYYDNDEVKRFTFAEKLAVLFEEYQSLETEMLRRWEEAPEVATNDTEAWQRSVWLAVKKAAGSELPNRSLVYKAIRQALKDETKVAVLKRKVPSVSFFGTILWTAELLKLLSDLSEHIDVRIYKLETPVNTCQLTEYLGVFQSQQDTLFSELASDIHIEIIEERVHSSSDNLLNRVQRRLRGENKEELIPADDSLTISSHFSINREVEALYHYLIGQFDNNDLLKPRDVCVITPDITRYAPAIKTAFEQKAYPIPYTLYDTSFQAEASPWKALEALLALEQSRFTATAVLSLLDYRHIREHFGISQLSFLKKALKKANIRHSFEGNPEWETQYSSWLYGFRRLILGACMPKTDQLAQVNGESFYPVGDFEGSAEVNELLLMYHFVETLYSWLIKRDDARTAGEWVGFLQRDTLEQLLALAPEEEVAITGILSDIARAGGTELNRERIIPYSVIHHHIRGRLGKLESGNSRGYGGVRFVAPNYTLSAPATIYAFLGLNSNVFPCVRSKLQFDLTRDIHPTATDLDKQLFMAMLLAAEQKCYISYIGQNIRDNSVIPPSSLTSALIQELEHIVTDFNGEKFIVRHPLHSFSSRYNSEARLVRYGLVNKLSDKVNPEWLKETPDYPETIENKDKFGRTIYDLQDMIRYMADPIRYYYQRQRRIFPEKEEDIPDDTELFDLDNLQQWFISQELLEIMLKNNANFSSNDYRIDVVRRGVFPLKSIGEFKLNSQVEDVKSILGIIQDKLNGYEEEPEEEHTLEIEGKDYVIRGKISNVFRSDNSEKRIFLYRTTSSDKYKYRLEAQARYQFIKNVKGNAKIVYIAREEKKLPESELNLLEKIADYYKDRFTCLLPFIGDIMGARFDSTLLSSPDSLNKYFNNELESPYFFPSEAFKIEFRNGIFRNKENCAKFKEVYDTLKPMLY